MNERSKQVRRDTITLSKQHGGYHFGGSFSAVEILIALYDTILTPKDKFILSKGHSCWPLYVILREKGYNPVIEGHPKRDSHNGIHSTTGSLGHGLPTAIGIAMAKKITNKPGKVYVLMGDGECQEGTTWESMLIAVHHQLDNLIVIVDWNRLQGSGFLSNILPIGGLGEIAKRIGWNTSTINGHNCIDIIDSMKNVIEKMPRFIIAHTVKGRGVSFMESVPEWHAKFPNQEEMKQAMEELE